MKSRHVTNLIIVMLILLIPIMALDIFATKPKIIMTSMDMVKAGDKEAAAGNYEEALRDYNKAEEKFASKDYLAMATNGQGYGSFNNPYNGLVSTEEHKANLFRKMGNEVAAKESDAKVLDFKNKANQWFNTHGCLIATATFDSPMAPQVQQLREFRENTIYSTKSGTQFMTAFNAWYYSFSPTVADFIDAHPSTKPPMRVILTPLLGILSFSKMSFFALSFNPDIAVIITGFVASTLIGMVYAFPVLFVLLVIIRRIHPFTFTTGILKALGGFTVTGLILLCFGGLLSASLVLLVGSVLFIVSLVLLTGLILSWVCMNRLDFRSAPVNNE